MGNFFRKYHLLFVLIFFLIATIIVTYPAILNLNGKLIGDGGDNYHQFAFQYIAAQKISKLQFPFVHTDILRYPVGFDFGAGSESVLVILTGAVLSIFTNSILAYNLTMLIFFTLNGLLSFILFKYLSKNFTLGLLGGLIYGYSSYVIARSAGHPNLFFVGGFPLLIYSILKCKNDFTFKNVFCILASLLLVYLGSYAYAILLFSTFLVFAPILLLFYRSETALFILNIFKKIPKIILISIPILVVIVIFGYSHFRAYFTGDYFKPDRTKVVTLLEYSPSIMDYFLPNKYLPLQITRIAQNVGSNVKSIEKVVFIGWIEIFLFFLFLVFYKNKREKYFIFTAVFAFFILTLGLMSPETKTYLPYFYLHKVLPFSFVDEPARFFVIFYLFITIGIIFLLRQIGRNDAGTKLLLIGLIILIFLEKLPLNYWVSPIFNDRPYVKMVKETEGAAVLDIPVSYENTVYDFLPYLYGKKIVSAPFHWFADTEAPKAFIKNNGLTRFICGGTQTLPNINQKENKKLIQTLKDNGVKTIVVHKNDPDDHAKYYFPECADARMQASILLPQQFMPDPIEKQKILSLFFPAVPDIGDTITIPYDGTFFIDGFHAFPFNRLPIHIYVDGKEIKINQNWKLHDEKNATLDPFLTIKVKKNSKIKFSFDNNYNMDYSFVKIWYRYLPNDKYVKPISIDGVSKIFEDDDAAVFYIK
jgi:hypothetical protein